MVSHALWTREASIMTWNVPGSRRLVRKGFQPACEPLEDRNLLSTFNLSSLTTGILPVLGGTMPPITLTPPAALPPIRWVGDQSGNVIVSKEVLQVTPGGDADSYTLALASQPTADVTITINQGDPRLGALLDLASPVNRPVADSTPLDITPTKLAFTADNWNVPQMVKVSAPATGDSSPSFVLLSHSVISDDPNFNNVFVPYVFVQVGDVTPPIPPPIQTGGVEVSTEKLDLVPGGPAQTYTLVLTSQPTADVTIDIRQSDPEVYAMVPTIYPPPAFGDPVPLTITPTTLTFTADNWNVPQTVTVSAPASPTAADLTRFTFLSHTVRSDDPNYNDLFVPNVFVRVGDDLPPIPPPIQTGGVEVSTQRLEVTAGGPEQTYTVVLTSQPTADVTINIAQQSNEIIPYMAGVIGPRSGPLVVTPTTLTFTHDNWDQPQTVTVSLPAGALVQEHFAILNQTVTSDDPNYSGIPAPSVLVHIADDSVADRPGLVVSTHHLAVTAGDTTGATYTLALATKPTADVTVTIQDSFSLLGSALGGALPPGINLGSLTVTPQTLTFTPDNWNMPQTVTVTAPAPASGGEFSIPFAVLFNTLKSDDPNYNNLFTPPVFVVIHGLTPPIGVPPDPRPIPEPPFPGLPIEVPPITIQPFPLPPVPVGVTPPAQGLPHAKGDGQLERAATNHKKTPTGANALTRRRRARRKHSNKGLSS
jgi:large repetitive protein